jgi:hypothetical protein
VQQALGFLLIDVFLDGDEALVGHQLMDLLARIGGEADVAVGEDADEATGLLDDGNAGDAVGLHQPSASASVASGPMVTG